MSTSRTGPSIRTKVLLASTLLLSVPWVGYQYVREMEEFLRAGLEAAVQDGAHAVAGALHDRGDLLPGLDQGLGRSDVYVHPLPHDLQIDGYADDWAPLLPAMRPFPWHEGSADARFEPRYLAARRDPYLYLLVEVEDDDVRYVSPGREGPPDGDHLRLVTLDPDGERAVYWLGTISPGWVTAQRYKTRPPADWLDLPGITAVPEPRIRAEWQETRSGYRVELRMPLSLVGQRLAVEVGDVAGADREVRSVASTAADGPGAEPGALILPSPALEDLIRSLGRSPGRRLSVLDRGGRVIARGGSLERALASPPINPLLAMVLPPPDGELFLEEPVTATLGGPEIDTALAGAPESRWRRVPGSQTFVVSAAYPVWQGERVVGAVVAEESSVAIQTVRRQALADLVDKTLLVTLAGGMGLLFLATRISTRLRRLRDQADAAIDLHGRVVATVPATRAGDEIGDLSRSFAAMTDRLQQYNHYLEQLARRLSHELRTPIAVVRSSLDALDAAGDAPDAPVYRERARQGLARLDAIITRMSEAARLEQALAETEHEIFDLAVVVGQAVEGYRLAFPDQRIELSTEGGPFRLRGAPDLLVQLLDKLVANAREFSSPGRPISIRLDRAGGEALRLEVSNEGPLLPEAMEGSLFDSMVSVRRESADREPHLGLGLYIVRLVAEHHGGSAGAENRADGGGVTVSVRLPIRPG